MNSRNRRRTAPAVHRIARDGFVHFAKPRRLCVRAVRGSLWVTVDGDPADIQLDAGDSRVFDRAGTVIVGAFGGEAAFTATPLASPGWAARLAAWLGAALPRRPAVA